MRPMPHARWSFLLLAMVAGCDSPNKPIPVAAVLRGAVVQATAILRDAAGNTLTGRPITWTSSNPQVATIDASGLVTTISRGATVVSATSEDQTGSIPLTVQNAAAIITSISP